MSSIPADSEWRGAAAYCSQPLSSDDWAGAQHLVEIVHYYNCLHPPPGVPALPDVEYRSSDREADILRHVFRWDDAPYEHVFQNGFIARRQGGVSDATYFNLELYVNHGGRPLDIRRETTHAFVSTTIRSGWHPSLSGVGQTREVYRYEIYAPGGILVAETLGDRYRYPTQDEICFVGGIAPQYIRSAQRFRLSTRDGRFTRQERVDDVLIFNPYFHPQSHPERLLSIRLPVDYCFDNQGRRQPLRIQYSEPQARREKRETRPVSLDNRVVKYYTSGVANEITYIDSAFRSTGSNEAYIFMKNEYVLVNYAPLSTDDYRINGPIYISNGYQSLTGTTFAENGIDCAFSCPGVDEAFIFSGKECAKINYAPGTTSDWIIEGPKTITQMFPCLKNSGFKDGIDAAFEINIKHYFTKDTGTEAYIFRGEYYAVLDFAERSVSTTRLIKDGFPCLANTIFASDIGAAFASHQENEAYLFKDEHYILLHFTRGATNDYIDGGRVKQIKSNWPSLSDILPRNNQGLDIYPTTKPQPKRDQDEL